uniref:Uncharacterized protein n=1 Tax=Anopheles albimanus TaxID=7167 RepID=A0A182FWJ9_ANOAL
FCSQYTSKGSLSFFTRIRYIPDTFEGTFLHEEKEGCLGFGVVLAVVVVVVGVFVVVARSRTLAPTQSKAQKTIKPTRSFI